MENEKINIHKSFLDKFSHEELKLIVQIKRFFECYEGDKAFRSSVNSGSFSSKELKYIKAVGVEFNPQEMALFWERPELIDEYITSYQKANKGYPKLSEPLAQQLSKYPLLKLWHCYMVGKSRYRYEECIRSLPIVNPNLEAWRNRRITACQSELGTFNHYVRHPILSFELSEGCSIQCWFCAFSSNRLKGVYNYNEGRDFFRGIALVCKELFGAEAAGVALPYYATEPYDNPNYIDFLKDYHDITGAIVCTSTAVCTDKKWIDSLIEFYRHYDRPWPRLSVLSTEILQHIHKNHSPDALRDVELAMQMKESVNPKISGGRIFDLKKEDIRHRDSTNYLKGIIPQGTIACVSGFYINFVRRDIKLVSPCYVSEKWPYGYRIYDEASFDTVEDFRRIMLEMMQRNMPMTPQKDFPLRLRDDLVLKRMEMGFNLVSPFQIHHFHNKEIFAALGDLLTKPAVTYGEAVNLLIDQYRQNPFEVHAVLKHLFEDGFMDEVGV